MADQESTPGTLILRDYLALDRTMLANERTLLSYLRTAIMLLISGITIIKLFAGNAIMVTFGALLLPLSAIAAGVGYVRFSRVRVKIRWSNAQPYSNLPDERG